MRQGHPFKGRAGASTHHDCSSPSGPCLLAFPSKHPFFKDAASSSSFQLSAASSSLTPPRSPRRKRRRAPTHLIATITCELPLPPKQPVEPPPAHRFSDHDKHLHIIQICGHPLNYVKDVYGEHNDTSFFINPVAFPKNQTQLAAHAFAATNATCSASTCQLGGHATIWSWLCSMQTISPKRIKLCVLWQSQLTVCRLLKPQHLQNTTRLIVQNVRYWNYRCCFFNV